MKLYFAPGHCSLAVHIALLEAGIEAELTRVDTVAGQTFDGADYRAINPSGYVPLLELDDGSRHTEVAALLQFVGDLAPATGLMPPFGSLERFKTLQWLAFVSSELHKAISPWLFQKDTAESPRSTVLGKLRARLDLVESRLARSDWLVNSGFTVADAYGFTVVSWAPFVGLDLSAWPGVRSWIGRVAERPRTRAALVAERLVQN